MLYQQNFILILLVVSIATTFIYLNSQKQKNDAKELKQLEYNRMKSIIEKQERILSELTKKINVPNKTETIETMENVTIDTIKESNQEQKKQINQDQINQQVQIKCPTQYIDRVNERDRLVLDDKLYPPLARTERPQFDVLMDQMTSKPDLFYMATRGQPDTFRMLGYLTLPNNNQMMDPNTTLILYGRAKYPNSDLGEFYVSSSNKLSDIKIPIDNTNSNIRRIWDIPNEVKINNNMISGIYKFTELPKSDLGTSPYI